MSRHIRLSGDLVLILALVGLGFGYLGPVHPMGDSVAPFRLWFAATALLVALPWRGSRALCAAPAALAVIWHIWDGHDRPQGVPQGAKSSPPPRHLVIYQKNLLRLSVDRSALLNDIRAKAPDVLMLQELSSENRFVIIALRDILPYRRTCGHSGDTSAILSRHPIIDDSNACLDTAVRVQLDTPLGPLWAVSLHLPWPWPFDQPEAVTMLTRWLAPAPGQSLGPMIISGDFNAAAWSHTLTRIEQASHTRRIGRAHVTYYFDRWNTLGIGIDHVLATQDLHGTVITAPMLGSDHLGLVATLWRS